MERLTSSKQSIDSTKADADRYDATPDDFCRPVYEQDPGDPLSQRLVVTPWMLLDWLKDWQEDAEIVLHDAREHGFGLERRYGVIVNPLVDRLEKLHGGIDHLLKLLWRGGLWTDEQFDEVTGADGKVYRVLRDPFTDGKPGGRPLPADAPAWQRDLLGLCVDDAELVPFLRQLAGRDPNTSNDIDSEDASEQSLESAGLPKAA